MSVPYSNLQPSIQLNSTAQSDCGELGWAFFPFYWKGNSITSLEIKWDNLPHMLLMVR